MTAPVAPPAVKDEYLYWEKAPPEPSPRLGFWKAKIAAGWRPNRRVRGMGYANAAPFFGVYIWEYIEVIYPLLKAVDA